MGTKQYDNYADLITFTRASGGTALRPVSYGEELVTNGTFDTDTTGWTALLGGLLSVSDGALRVEEDGVDASTGRAFQIITTEVGKVYRLTVDLVDTNDNFEVYVNTNTNYAGALVFDNTKSTPQTLELVFVATATSTYIILGAGSPFVGTYCEYDNISVKEVVFDRAGDPLTLFNHPNNVPRVEYDVDGNRLGLLIEEQRTNLLTESENFTNNPWIKNGGNITTTASVSTSPDGATNAYVVNDTGSGDDFIYQNISVAADTKTYCYSVFVEKTTSDTHYMNIVLAFLGGTVAYWQGTFDTNTGLFTQFGGGASVTSQDWGDWWRISISAPNNGTNTTAQVRLFPAYNINGTTARRDETTGSKVFFGAQLEEGSFATSYIPTSGSTATRSADIASIPTSAFGYNQKAGTVVVEVSGLSPTTGQYVFDLHDTTANEQIYLRFDNASIGRGVVFDNGSVVFNSDATGSKPSANTFVKYALGTARDNFAVTANGNSPVVDTSGTMPTVTQLAIGGRETSSTGHLNGHIKSIQYYPRRLTNSQIQELTS